MGQSAPIGASDLADSAVRPRQGCRLHSPIFLGLTPAAIIPNRPSASAEYSNAQESTPA